MCLYNVKALLQVMQGIYSMNGGVEWQIQHEVKLSAAFDMRSNPEYCIFCTSQVNGSLTDLLFCVGRINSCSSESHDAYKQIVAIVTVSLYYPNNVRW